MTEIVMDTTVSELKSVLSIEKSGKYMMPGIRFRVTEDHLETFSWDAAKALIILHRFEPDKYTAKIEGVFSDKGSDDGKPKTSLQFNSTKLLDVLGKVSGDTKITFTMNDTHATIKAAKFTRQVRIDGIPSIPLTYAPDPSKYKFDSKVIINPAVISTALAPLYDAEELKLVLTKEGLTFHAYDDVQAEVGTSTIKADEFTLYALKEDITLLMDGANFITAIKVATDDITMRFTSNMPTVWTWANATVLMAPRIRDD